MTELEAAIADTGALLVRAQKYRRGSGPDGATLARQALALGDTARRLHRRDTLDASAAGALLAEARALADALRDFVAEVQRTAEYRAAVAAHAAGDRTTLVRLLPTIFAGLERASEGVDLFLPIPWLRRGRLRPPADVAAEIDAARTAGVPAEGDDVSPGADAALPAVAVMASPPPDDPVVLRVPADARVGPLFRLSDSGDLVVHTARLVVPTAIARIAERLQLDEQLRVEIDPEAWMHWRTELADALAAAGVPVEPA